MKPIVAQAASYYVMSSMYVGNAMQLADNKKVKIKITVSVIAEST